MVPYAPTKLRVSPVLVGMALISAASAALAAPVKPRFLIVVDTSGSMAENASGIETHGDGSQAHPGCDLDNNGLYDDSKLFQAKAALNDTIAAFGAAEFSLARYHQKQLGGACQTVANCTGAQSSANVCVANNCAYEIPTISPDYDECSGGNANGNGCIRCADPDNDPTHVYFNGNLCCTGSDPKAGGFGMAGDVLVPFPGGSGNHNDMLAWMDGVETFPAGLNKELRATGTTPIGGSLNAVRDWLTNDGSPAGPGAGVLNRDSQVDCRSYNVILITDGIETASCASNCGINGALAAENLFYACTNGGLWDPIDNRCERNGSPANTRRIRVRTYVVGFNVNSPSLNAIAASGGTGTALLANNRTELTARLGDIIAASIPNEKCDCQDNTCDGAIDETFPLKGEVCSVGVGRCKRQGVFACKPDGGGVACASSPSGMCPATLHSPGSPLQERCGSAPGCLAPTPEDCADDDCDGLIDENLSCACAAKPEVCNGLDDDCNGVIDDVPPTSCGLSIGECRPGQLQCGDDGAGGKRAICVGGTSPTPELCDGKDNDCDGIVDGFGLSCYPENTAGCARNMSALACQAAPLSVWTCQGVCQTGVLICDNGSCGACGGAITPQPEVACDGLDNDCDGQTDEGFGLGQACGPGQSGIGECRAGVLRCANNGLVCEGAQGPVDETCDGKDNDCDGLTDNLKGPCGLSLGECRPGAWRCEGSTPVCEQVQAPTPEFCDGKDNDCDGLTDEDPLDPDLRTPTACGVDEGVCRKGLLRCLGGGKYCDESVDPSFERCNALDDNCNGQTDEGINPPGMCPPPGLPPGTGLVGECRPGANMCLPTSPEGAGWSCVGGVGPAPEVCDGKDNDCDGAVDNNAPCDPGFACAFGECAPKCTRGEFECAVDRICQDGVCVFTECVRTPCPTGFRCDAKRGCVDRCEDVTCAEGFRCENGICLSCQNDGCPSGQLCRGVVCEPDPCLGVSCPGGSYCSEGVCAASCTGVKCSKRQSESCRLGQCVPDRCLGVTCGRHGFCDPSTGACVNNPCVLIQCLRGRVCVPTTASCQPDPCLATVCKGEDVCVMRVDGIAECVSPDSLPKLQPDQKIAASGGGGCTCQVGPARSAPKGGLWLLLGLALCTRPIQRLRKRRCGGAHGGPR